MGRGEFSFDVALIAATGAVSGALALIDKADRFFDRHGAKVVLFGRLAPEYSRSCRERDLVHPAPPMRTHVAKHSRPDATNGPAESDWARSQELCWAQAPLIASLTFSPACFSLDFD